MGRIYHTGDSGRLNVRGMFTVDVRVASDAQVKVRGFRIELAEIEIVGQLRARLSVSSPQYMVPAVIVPIDEMALTAHGKIDRKAVQAFPAARDRNVYGRARRARRASYPPRAVLPSFGPIYSQCWQFHWACRLVSSALAVTRCC